MTVLGIARQGAEGAAALVADGRLVAAVAGALESPLRPVSAHAVEACLGAAGLEPGEVETVVVCGDLAKRPRWGFPAAEGSGAAAPGGALRGAVRAAAPGLRPRVWRSAEPLGALADAAFWGSPVHEGVVLLWPDGPGSGASGAGSYVFRARRGRVTPLWRLPAPDAPGWLLARFARALGLTEGRAAYELAYLAAFGRARLSRELLEGLVSLHRDGSYRLKPLAARGDDAALQRWLGSLAGTGPALVGRRDRGAVDLARSMAAVLRYLVAHTAVHVTRLTGTREVCLGGDTALELARHGLLPDEPWVRRAWVHPQGGAVALAAGAALGAWHAAHGEARPEPGVRWPAAYPYLGPGYSELSLQGFLMESRIPADTLPPDRAPGRAAELVRHGNRVGWFQGRESSGAGLAGDRATLRMVRRSTLDGLADPRRTGRIPGPLTLYVMDEYAERYFDVGPEPPFASAPEAGPLLTPWRESGRDIPVGSGPSPRPPVKGRGPVMLLRISARRAPGLYRFLAALLEQTGLPVVQAQPLFPLQAARRAPADAYELLRAGDVDTLVLGDSVLYQGRDLPRLEAAPPSRSREGLRRLWQGWLAVRGALGRTPARGACAVAGWADPLLRRLRREGETCWIPAPGAPGPAGPHDTARRLPSPGTE